MSRSAPVSALRTGIATLVALAFAGCTTTFEGSKIDYKSDAKAQAAPRLEVPPDLSTLPKDDRYAVPQSTTASAMAKAPTTTTSPSGVLPTSPVAHLRRDGSVRYLLIDQPAEDVWPVITKFWESNGFALRYQDAQSGVMETDWAENRAKLPQDFLRRTIGRVFDSLYDTGTRDLFRVRLERVPGGTEVYLTHRGMEEVLVGQKDSTIWQPRPNDPSLEGEFLQRLLVRFGLPEASAATEVANLTAAVPAARARIVGDALQLDDPIDRGWRRVGIALDRGGFTVETRDRTAGVYGVRFVPPGKETEEDPGFFARMFGAKPANVARQFKVSVKESGSGTRVTVQPTEGGQDKSESTARILELLQGELK
ncbi:outer membrane protein assembly factor BamC [Derxia gummosa]|uniref:Outer membrane protein assembly factor BamC n=1 Tax=Derxia gummosa DSM 723 TaxID=1121388 RepID=A0A8B6X9A4_9BURK|nr:outer membrane protein assembly factor BamC [Derxia gummosa]